MMEWIFLQTLGRRKNLGKIEGVAMKGVAVDSRLVAVSLVYMHSLPRGLLHASEEDWRGVVFLCIMC